MALGVEMEDLRRVVGGDLKERPHGLRLHGDARLRQRRSRPEALDVGRGLLHEDRGRRGGGGGIGGGGSDAPGVVQVAALHLTGGQGGSGEPSEAQPGHVISYGVGGEHLQLSSDFEPFLELDYVILLLPLLLPLPYSSPPLLAAHALLSYGDRRRLGVYHTAEGRYV